MKREPARAVIAGLLAVVLLLIAYGSLYPFDFQPGREGGLWRALTQLSWQRAGRGDRILNVLLYLPLGFCVCLLLARRYRRRVSVALATGAGALLSLCIEVLQFYTPIRVSSLTDVVLNATGSFIGATGGLAWRSMNALMHQPARGERQARDPGAVLVTALWLLASFAPFVPELDLGRLKAALQPLFAPRFEPAAVFVFLTCWLVVNQALAAFVSRPRRLEALLIVIALVLIGRLVVANQTFVPAELLALVLLLPLIVLMHRLRPRPRRTALVLATAAALILEGLAPFDFTASGAYFEFWPFMASSVALNIHWIELFVNLFFAAAFLWTLKEWGASVDAAALTTAVLVVGIEVLQTWLPGRDASITDPLLGLLLCWTMRALYTSGGRLETRGWR